MEQENSVNMDNKEVRRKIFYRDLRGGSGGASRKRCNRTLQFDRYVQI